MVWRGEVRLRTGPHHCGRRFGAAGLIEQRSYGPALSNTIGVMMKKEAQGRQIVAGPVL